MSKNSTFSPKARKRQRVKHSHLVGNFMKKKKHKDNVIAGDESDGIAEAALRQLVMQVSTRVKQARLLQKELFNWWNFVTGK